MACVIDVIMYLICHVFPEEEAIRTATHCNVHRWLEAANTSSNRSTPYIQPISCAETDSQGSVLQANNCQPYREQNGSGTNTHIPWGRVGGQRVGGGGGVGRWPVVIYWRHGYRFVIPYTGHLVIRKITSIRDGYASSMLQNTLFSILVGLSARIVGKINCNSGSTWQHVVGSCSQ